MFFTHPHGYTLFFTTYKQKPQTLKPRTLMLESIINLKLILLATFDCFEGEKIQYIEKLI